MRLSKIKLGPSTYLLAAGALLTIQLISLLLFDNLLLEFFLTIISLGLLAAIFFHLKDERQKAKEKIVLTLGDCALAEEITADEELLKVLAELIIKLTNDYKGLAGSLNNIVEFTRRVSSKSDQIQLGTEAQSFSMEETSTSIEGISASIINLVAMVEKLFPSAEKATKSILEMVDSNKRISMSTQDLFTNVKGVSTHIDSLVTSVANVEHRFDDLTKSSEGTSKSVHRIDKSIKDIEEQAGYSSDLANQVRTDAEGGAVAAEKTITGMSRIREIVSESAEVVQRLGEKSGEVGDIINVINEITDRTNLLALNASIIAAQAGEHGKAFSVVAEEIKRLADQTAQSTVEISSIVQGIQSMVSDVIQANEMGKWSAEEGVKLAHEAGNALRKILESTTKSTEMSKLIAQSTVNQARETAIVIRTITNEQNVIKEIEAIIKEDTELSEKIRTSTKKMVEITRTVAQANTDQEKANTEVTHVIEEVKELVQGMFEVTRTQKTDSDQILQAIEIIKYISLENINAINELAGGAGELKVKIENLNSEYQEIGLE
ncbi:MAG: hypothetical protein KAR06_11885 [Deltaproteobacteria bacterium]|nr:hypothetical protein [Deltaproteobacteria bacterium]